MLRSYHQPFPNNDVFHLNVRIHVGKRGKIALENQWLRKSYLGEKKKKKERVRGHSSPT